jgi:hypothetical protein
LLSPNTNGQNNPKKNKDHIIVHPCNQNLL